MRRVRGNHHAVAAGDDSRPLATVLDGGHPGASERQHVHLMARVHVTGPKVSGERAHDVDVRRVVGVLPFHGLKLPPLVRSARVAEAETAPRRGRRGRGVHVDAVVHLWIPEAMEHRILARRSRWGAPPADERAEAQAREHDPQVRTRRGRGHRPAPRAAGCGRRSLWEAQTQAKKSTLKVTIRHNQSRAISLSRAP